MNESYPQTHTRSGFLLEQWSRGVSEIFVALESAQFDRVVFQAISRLVQIDFIVAFAYRGRVRPLILGCTVEESYRRVMLDDYVSGPYLLDPFFTRHCPARSQVVTVSVPSLRTIFANRNIIGSTTIERKSAKKSAFSSSCRITSPGFSQFSGGGNVHLFHVPSFRFCRRSNLHFARSSPSAGATPASGWLGLNAQKASAARREMNSSTTSRVLAAHSYPYASIRSCH